MSHEDEARRLAEEWAEEYGDESISLPLFLAAKFAPILAERDQYTSKALAYEEGLQITREQDQRIADLEATLRDVTNLKSADVQRIAALEAEVAGAIAELSEMYTDTTPQEYAGDQPIPHSPTLSESVMAVKAEVDRWKPKDEHGDPWTPDSYVRSLETKAARLDAILSGERVWLVRDDSGEFFAIESTPGAHCYARLPEREK